jgi:hypothetical protein
LNETAIRKQIKDALEAAGFWVVITASRGKRSKRGVKTGEPGIPDLHLVEFGAWGEVKVPGGRRSDGQIAWHARAAKIGVRVFVWESPSDALRDSLRLRKEREFERQMGWKERTA